MLKTIVSYLILIVIVHFINWLATKHSGCHFFVLSSMPPLMFDFYWDQNVHVHVSSMGNHELRGLRGHGLVSHSWCRFPVTLSGPYTTKAQRKSFVSSPTIRAKISNSLTIAHICFLKLKRKWRTLTSTGKSRNCYRKFLQIFAVSFMACPLDVAREYLINIWI